ncbi:DUF3953 domain-containing protein [Psychrobacillus sp. NEAU-3TGS]|uniref:DUF3953 domain-containing protein n=1 Tax=Psychrobacillus sp. NEAU-3TGS TaxID=2995412 RepID=UPI0024996C4B|nr:DUF3953 domain-containing protein [Psychrobacillus sp. NEAU-3TGS]MDI2588611.1 DUF3953 domain-containing protein [Psychrobacillus sp. NEAU-3TGS]
MLKILRIISSFITFALAGYSLITKNFEFMPYMLLFLCVSVFVTGVLELKAKRKTRAIISFLAVAFAFFVVIYAY